MISDLSITSKNPNDEKSVWNVTKGRFSMITDWETALTWLEGEIVSHNVAVDDVILAGPHKVPWLLEYFLVAAECINDGDREGVFESYGLSAAALIAKHGEQYREALTAPWVPNA